MDRGFARQNARPVKIVCMTNLAVIQSNAFTYPRNQTLLKALRETINDLEMDGAYVPDKLNILGLISYFLNHPFQSRRILFLWPASHMLLPIFILKYFRGKTIVLDVFTSMYDSLVNDRQTIGRFSVKALYHYCREYLILHMSDVLLFDTQSQKDYLTDLFGVKAKQSVVLPVTIDLNFLKSIPVPTKGTHFAADKFNVFFYGTFIPLQGIEFIIKAVNLTREVDARFWILGRGQKYDEMHKLAEQEQVLDRLTFLPSVGYSDLIGYIKEADLCLGIFGGTQKAQRVIPNKLLESAACAKPIVTGSSPEIGNYFKDGESAIFCPMGDAKALAEKICWAAGHPKDLENLGCQAQKVVEENFGLDLLNRKLKQFFLEYV